MIAEPVQQQTRITQMCGESLGAGVTTPAASGGTGNITTWTNCGGRVELIDILQSGHMVTELQATSGQQLVNLIGPFISAN